MTNICPVTVTSSQSERDGGVLPPPAHALRCNGQACRTILHNSENLSATDATQQAQWRRGFLLGFLQSLLQSRLAHA